MKINPFERLKTESLEIDEYELDSIMQQDDFIIALVTATKPDFYKQWPLIPAAEKYKLPLFVLNTGQHYDETLGYGLKEFGIEEKLCVNLNIRGDLSQKSTELILKVKYFANYLQKKYPKKIILPVVHGDTHAAGILPLAWMFATNKKCAQNEAGLRAMSPEFKNYKNIVKFIDDQFSCNWKINRTEPFPEQYNTFIGGAGSHLHFAPVNLNKENLVREGYFEQNIFVVGNSIIDAIEQKRGNKKSSIFDIYPILEEKNDWIRVDIHRRGNLLCSRIKAIIKGMKELLKRGYNVNLIEMNAFSHALKQHNLYNDLNKLKNYKNFLHTPLWPEYAHVIEFLESGKCFAEFTDSGSMQEELNEIEQTICLTCRFNTDRPETIFEAKTNLLVPPIDGEYIANFVDYIYNTELCETMKKGKKLYGKGVANKIIQILNTQKEYPFTWAHEIAGFKESEKFQNFL